MRKEIKVSFRNKPDDNQLYDDIIAESKRTYLGLSGFMKLAAREKLERDLGGGKSESSNKPRINTVNQSGGIINSLDDLFGK